MTMQMILLLLFNESEGGVCLLTASDVPWLLLLMVQIGPPYAATVYLGLRFSRSYSVISPFRPAVNRR